MSHTNIVGHTLCVRCQDALVLTVIANRTGQICEQCLTERGSPFKQIEVEANGTRFPVPIGPPKERRPKRPETEASKAREKVVDKCKDRALRRLRTIFPDLYDILLAEERANAGLPPWPLGSAIRYGPDPDGSQTEAFAVLYHALQDLGVNA